MEKQDLPLQFIEFDKQYQERQVENKILKHLIIGPRQIILQQTERIQIVIVSFVVCAKWTSSIMKYPYIVNKYMKILDLLDPTFLVDIALELATFENKLINLRVKHNLKHQLKH